MMSLCKGDGSIIMAGVKVADTPLKQAMGLMLRKSFSGAMVFDLGHMAYGGIHMLFVRFPIDVVFLDEERRIIGLKPGVRPWLGFAVPISRFRYAVELPAGTIERFSLKIGEQLRW